MRRALLTTRNAAVPISVGQSAGTFATSLASQTAAYTKTNPATATGTLTTASTSVGPGISIYFFSINPATMTVRAVSGTVTTATGLNAYAISLPVVAGDFIGVATASGTATFRYATSGGGGMAYSGSAHPAVGDSVAAFTTIADYNLQLSGAS